MNPLGLQTGVQTSTQAVPSKSTGTIGAGLAGIAQNAGLGQQNLSQSSSAVPSTNLPSTIAAPAKTTIASPFYNSSTPSATLASTPVNNTPAAHSVVSSNPLTVTAAPVDTTSSALSGYTSSAIQQYQTQNNTRQAVTAITAANNQSNSQNNQNVQPNQDLTSRIAEQYGIDPKAITATLATEPQVTQSLNAQYDTAGKTKAAQDAYNNYNAAQLALNQQIEQIRTTPGISTEQAQQQISEVSKEGNANLANLAVINQAAQGNMSTAMNIVQMKLDQQFKPLQDQIDAIGKFNTVNNADLTSSQQTQLENQRFVMQNNLNTLMTAKQTAHQFALQQGIQDPNILNAIDKGTTPAEVYAAVGMSADGSAPTNTSNPSISPQYASYQAQTVKGNSYVSQDKLTNLTPYQQQEAARQYAAAGIPVLTSGQTGVIQNVDTTRENLNDLNSITTSILGSGAKGRVKSSIANFIGGALQTNTDVASFNNYRLLAIGALKSLGAGTGGAKITAGEIQTAQDNLPTIYDSLQTAQKKSAILTSQLDKWENELLPQQGTSNGLYDF